MLRLRGYHAKQPVEISPSTHSALMWSITLLHGFTKVKLAAVPPVTPRKKLRDFIRISLGKMTIPVGMKTPHRDYGEAVSSPDSRRVTR
jgi:hypothetical protein